MRAKTKRLILIILMLITLGGCGKTTSSAEIKSSEANASEDKKYSQDIFAMDTYMTITAYGKNSEEAVVRAADEVKRLDELLSTGDSNSEIYEINKKKGGKLTKDTEYLFERAVDIYDSTGGLFDIAIYPVMDEWGFFTENYKLPDNKRLTGLLEYINVNDINFDKESKSIELMSESAIDFGGIAKGYTSGRIMDIFREEEITSGLVSLGGNVQLYGRKTDGSLWKVGIQDPDNEGEYLGVLEAEDVAIITSGGYERYFELDGKKYHHIIDPRTGYPADSGLKSVTIVSKDGTLADGLSTALFVMGPEDAICYWRKYSSDFDMILMRDDNSLIVSGGIADSFESEYEVEIIEKE